MIEHAETSIPTPIAPGVPPAGPTTSFATNEIHGGTEPDPTTGAILTPIHQSTTFVQDAVGTDRGFTYSRSSNPTVSALERRLGAIEGAEPAVCFATGMAAISALAMSLLRAGDHVVASDVVYGGTVRLLRDVLGRFGVAFDLVDTADLDAVRAAIRPETRLVFVETPANPTLKLTDIAGVATIAHAAGIPLAVDNTFLTPAVQRPLELDADVVVYSTTKYIEGHNATVGGAIVSRDEAILERVRFTRNALGLIQSPFEAWLTLRGVKTLSMRMAQHASNALEVARFLRDHPRVASLHYPGLDDFPQAELARRQQRSGGGIVAFEVIGPESSDGDAGAPPGGCLRAGVEFMNALRLTSLAENLGAVETLVTHPASMTHADVPPADRRRAGISDGLIRLSVGLEDPADIIRDVAHALDVAAGEPVPA